MKKIIFAFIALATLSFQANAQVKRDQKGSKSEMHSQNNRKMDRDAFKDLNLTADQQAKLKASREDAKLKMEAIKNDNTLTEAQKKERMMTLRKEQKAGMENVLTKEQKEKMKNAQKERKEKMNDKKNDRKENVKNNLELSKDQTNKIKEYNKASQQRMKAIKDDSTLTQEQKKAKMMAEQKAKKDYLNNLLTPDQKLKMKEGKKDWKGKKGKRDMNTQMNNK